ncbi:Disulfide bond formation protein DsbB [Salinihabitans flavidus]|uniref:Disulfide bond formation protein DsbB n=1 Tax=Salinihabitans flavidus TaxID=569882 RepID=A0A1H8NUL5_9RHOB|nr:disulfide bond formation protein B [Salinihabitans flavidus]SEO33291.1 Disulfide bond formation protein DsbB [Salinihabitans flavidus]
MRLSRTTLTLLLTLASAAMLLAAWGSQYIGGLAPCKLCYWQRYPHMAAVALGLIGMALGARLWSWLAAAALATTALLGLYHSGVERGLWQGPSTCSSSGVGGVSADELMNRIMSAPLVRCDEIAWAFHGFTMANLNAIGSAILALLWVWVARRSEVDRRIF